MICSGELELFNLNDTNTLRFLNFIIGVSDSYGIYHKYISLFLCSFGNLANLIHIWVLTRPRMWKYVINKLLSVIAAGDILKMTFYIVYIIRFDFMVDHTNPPLGFDLWWVVFAIGHVVATIALHTMGLYLWAATAFIRYKASHKRDNVWNRYTTAWCGVSFATTLLILTLCIPTMLVHEIIKTEAKNGNTLYQVGISNLSKQNGCLIFKLTLWLKGIFFKIVPCVLLLIFTFALCLKLKRNFEKRKLLIPTQNLAKIDRTTLMLVILLVIFLVTEIPQGILSILNALYPNDIHQYIYKTLGEFLDLMSLINCNACFLLYPIMSSVYRKTLKKILVKSYKNPNKSLYYYCSTIYIH